MEIKEKNTWRIQGIKWHKSNSLRGTHLQICKQSHMKWSKECSKALICDPFYKAPFRNFLNATCMMIVLPFNLETASTHQHTSDWPFMLTAPFAFKRAKPHCTGSFRFFYIFNILIQSKMKNESKCQGFLTGVLTGQTRVSQGPVPIGVVGTLQSH